LLLAVNSNVKSYIFVLNKILILIAFLQFGGLINNTFCEAAPAERLHAVNSIISGEHPVQGLTEFLIGGYEWAMIHDQVPLDYLTLPTQYVSRNNLESFTALLFRSVDESQKDAYPYRISERDSFSSLPKFEISIGGNHAVEAFQADQPESPDAYLHFFRMAKNQLNVKQTIILLKSEFAKKYSDLKTENPIIQNTFSELAAIATELKKNPQSPQTFGERENLDKARVIADYNFANKYGGDRTQAKKLMPDQQQALDFDWKRMYQRAQFVDAEVKAQIPEHILRQLRLQSLQARFHRVVRDFITFYYKELYKDLTISVWKYNSQDYTREKVFQGNIDEVLDTYSLSISGYTDQKYFHHSIDDRIELGDKNLSLFVDHLDRYKDINSIHAGEQYRTWSHYEDFKGWFPYQGEFDNLGLVDGLLSRKELLKASEKIFKGISEVLAKNLFPPEKKSLDQKVIEELTTQLTLERVQQKIFNRWFDSTFPNEKKILSEDNRYLALSGFSALRFLFVDKFGNTDELQHLETLALQQKAESIWKIWSTPSYLEKLLGLGVSTNPRGESANEKNIQSGSSAKRTSKIDQVESPTGTNTGIRIKTEKVNIFEQLSQIIDTRQSQFNENKNSDGEQISETLFRVTNKKGGWQNYISGPISDAETTDDFLFPSDLIKKSDIIVEQNHPTRPINNVIPLLTPIYHKISAIEIKTNDGLELKPSQYSVRPFKSGGYYFKIHDDNLKAKEFLIKAGYHALKISVDDSRLENLDSRKFLHQTMHLKELGLNQLVDKVLQWQKQEQSLDQIISDVIKVLEYQDTNPAAVDRVISEKNPFRDLVGYVNSKGGLTGVCREHNELFSILLNEYFNDQSDIRVRSRTAIMLNGKKANYRIDDDLHVITEIVVGDRRLYMDSTGDRRGLYRYLNISSFFSGGLTRLLLLAKRSLTKIRTNIKMPSALGDSDSLIDDDKGKVDVSKDKADVSKDKTDLIEGSIELKNQEAVKQDIHAESSQKNISKNSGSGQGNSSEKTNEQVVPPVLPPEPPLDIADPDFLNLVSQLGNLVQGNQKFAKENRKLIEQLGTKRHPAAFLSYTIVVLHLYLYNEREFKTMVERLKQLAGLQTNYEVNRENLIPWLRLALQKFETRLELLNKETLKRMKIKGYKLSPVETLSLQAQTFIKPLYELINLPIMRKHYLVGDALKKYEVAYKANKEVHAIMPSYRKNQINQDRMDELQFKIDEMNLSWKSDASRFMPPSQNTIIMCETLF
jgi:hypothetical protein